MVLYELTEAFFYFGSDRDLYGYAKKLNCYHDEENDFGQIMDRNGNQIIRYEGAVACEGRMIKTKEATVIRNIVATPELLRARIKGRTAIGTRVPIVVEPDRNNHRPDFGDCERIFRLAPGPFSFEGRF